MNSNSNSANQRKYNKRNYSHRRKKTPITDSTSGLSPPWFLFFFFDQEKPPLLGRESLSLAPGNDMRWYRIYTTMPHPSYCKKLTLSWPEPGQQNSRVLVISSTTAPIFQNAALLYLCFIFLWTSMGLKAAWNLVEIRIFQLCQDLM